MATMQCPTCRAWVADNLLQCSNCAGNLSFTVLAPDGQQYGPYALQSLQQYLAEGRIDPNCQASVAGQPWAPVQQVLQAVGAGVAAPGAGGAPAPVLPPAGPPGVYQGDAAAAQRPTGPKKKKGMSCWVIGGIILAILLIPVLILAAILFPAMGKARQKAQQASCQSNLKQVGLGFMMFSQDYNGVFPTSDQWQTQLQPYVKDTSLFQCPVDQKAYEMSPAMSGANLNNLATPAMTALMYDAGFPTGTPPHAGGWNVLFADGHCKWVSKAEAGSYSSGTTP